MLTPAPAILSALPKAWTPGTNGAVRGQAMKFKVEKVEDLDALAGKLAGKILMIEESSEPRRTQDLDKEVWSDEELDELAGLRHPRGARQRRMARAREEAPRALDRQSRTAWWPKESSRWSRRRRSRTARCGPAATLSQG